MPFDWTEEREATVTKMWEDGHSANQIAQRLTNGAEHPVTRNAVIGKVRRLKLPFRACHGGLSAHGRNKSGDFTGRMRRGKLGGIQGCQSPGMLDRRTLGDDAPRQPRGHRFLESENTGSITNELARALIEHGPDLIIPPVERRTLDKLEPGDCRWPFGDPRTADYHYCNRMAVGAVDRFHRGALPYCEFHAKRAYRTTPVAKSINDVGNRMAFRREPFSPSTTTKELAEFDEMKR